MSRAEVIQAVDALGKEDRAFLSAYLKAKDLSEDPSFAEASAQTLAVMRNGDGLRSSEIRELHRSLESKGL